MENDRQWATVYERSAWLHDTGKHADAEFPYAFCPRCEMEHPKGRFAVLRDVLTELRQEFSHDGEIIFQAQPVSHIRSMIDAALAGDSEPL